MEYEWDAAKAFVNFRKHGVDFADAAGVFDDPHALSMPAPSLHEQRFVVAGIDFVGRVLIVVYTFRGERIRIISARRATPSERRIYERDIT